MQLSDIAGRRSVGEQSFGQCLARLKWALLFCRTDRERVKTSPSREAIANSVLRIVTSSLKGAPDPVIERAVLQARREADALYNLVIDINVVVQEALPQRSREYLFLLGYLCSLIRAPVTADLEQQLRELMLLFVEEVLLLKGAISQVSADHLDGQPILFSDSAAKLKEQTDLVEQALKHLNRLAEQLEFAELSREEICDRLRAEVDQQVSRWLIVARSAMLAVFGEHLELISNFKHLSSVSGIPSHHV